MFAGASFGPDDVDMAAAGANRRARSNLLSWAKRETFAAEERRRRAKAEEGSSEAAAMAAAAIFIGWIGTERSGEVSWRGRALDVGACLMGLS